jgi:hypothetical protein
MTRLFELWSHVSTKPLLWDKRCTLRMAGQSQQSEQCAATSPTLLHNSKSRLSLPEVLWALISNNLVTVGSVVPQ